MLWFCAITRAMPASMGAAVTRRSVSPYGRKKSLMPDCGYVPMVHANRSTQKIETIVDANPNDFIFGRFFFLGLDGVVERVTTLQA